MESFVDNLKSLPEYRDIHPSVPSLLDQIFSNLHYVWITRRNKVRQAVSHCRASQTGLWTRSVDSRATAPKVPEFNF